MIRKIVGIRFVCALAAISAIAVPASAQQVDPGGGNPFAGLFRGSPAGQPQTLDISGSAFGAWDDNPLAQAPGASGVLPAGASSEPGWAHGLQAALTYGLHVGGDRSALNVNGNASVQQFGSTARAGSTLFDSYNAAAAFNTKLTNKVSLMTSAGAAYAPYYQYAPYLKGTINDQSPAGSDYGYAVDSTWVRSESASVGIDDKFSKRSTINGTLSWNQSMMTDQDSKFDAVIASARYTHNLTRKLSVHVGYGIQQAESSIPGHEAVPYRSHLMDVGVGYGDGLTFTFARYYQLSLGFGVSIVKNGDPTSVLTTGESTALAVSGNATLSRAIGRSWGASIGYQRSTGYTVGYLEPMTTDAASAGIGGPIRERLYFSAAAGASRGVQVFTTTPGGTLVAYTATSRLTYGLFTNLGLYAQASYYHYNGSEPFNALLYAPKLSRRSISVGLSTWLPLIKPPRVRRSTPDEPPTDPS